MAYIEIKNLTKVIRGNTVLDDINLSLEKNKIYGFVGINGSGKTMLFRAICGLIKPTSGSVAIDGKRIGKDISFPKDLGVIIENSGLWNERSGFENLKILTSMNKKVSPEKIKETIKRVGLDPEDKRIVKKYSLGMKQRIVIAQAIMEDPELLVLDEPTNALDADGVELIRSILLEEKEKGKTILLASHNSQDISTLCDKVYYMNGGKIDDKTD